MERVLSKRIPRYFTETDIKIKCSPSWIVSRDSRALLFRANKHELSPVTVQLQFILGPPVLNVDIAVRCGFQKRKEDFGDVIVLWLSVVGIEVVNDAVLVDDVSQRCSAECKKNRPKHRSLWNSTGKRDWLGLGDVHRGCLEYV